MISANQALSFSRSKTGKLSEIRLSDNVFLREPENLVLAETAQLDLRTRQEKLQDVFYRTTL